MSNSSTENNRKPGRKPGCVKTGGRQKGVLNKKSYWLRDQLEQIEFDWAKDFKQTMTVCDYERAKILIDLLPYLNPKIEPRHIEDESDSDSDIFEPLVVHHLIKQES